MVREEQSALVQKLWAHGDIQLQISFPLPELHTEKFPPLFVDGENKSGERPIKLGF